MHVEMPGELRDRASSLNFDSTISRKLVHRNYIDHVLVTDLGQIADDHFLCAGRLPQMHGFFNEECKTPCCNLLAVSEIARQACIALSHRYLEVPAGTAQIVRQATGSMEDRCLTHARNPREADFLVEIRLTDRQYRRSGELTALTAEYFGYSDFCRVFHGSGDWMFVSRKMYRRLRQASAEPVGGEELASERQRLIEPRNVGRHLPDHVVIAPTVALNGGDAYSTELIADPKHPFFFEHEIDHVSGMLLLEGCNQFALAMATELYGYPPRQTAFESYSAKFYRFAGLQSPVHLQASIKGRPEAAGDRCRAAFEVVASQDGEVLADIDVGVAPIEQEESQPPVQVAAG